MNTKKEMPKILFKYRDFDNEYNRRTLFNFELFLASTSMFNDPYEGAIPFAYDPKELTSGNVFKKLRELAIHDNPDWEEAQIHEYCFEGQQKDLINDPAHIEKFNEQNRKDIDNTFGICSLTIHPLNYLMWSHYANSHNGFCIGFDSKILYKTVGDGLGPVYYDSEIPKLKLFGDTFDFHKTMLATKSNVWSYEDEFRLVKSGAARQTIVYPKEMIKLIYLGCKLSLENKNKIIEFVKDNNIECEIHELSLDNSIFKLIDLRIY